MAVSKASFHSVLRQGGEDSSPGLARPLDQFIAWLFGGLICVTPWAFGSKYAWGEEIVLLFATAIGVLFCARLLFVRDARMVRSWTYLPIATFVSLVVLQLVRLPRSLLNVLSPNTLELKTRLLADLPGATAGRLTLTFYPYETLHHFRMLLSVVVIFVVALNVFRGRPAIKRVLTIISVVGAAVMSIALAQDLTDTDKIYWIYNSYMVRAVGGPFQSHNHYCQFANLSIGAATALLLLNLAEARAYRGGRTHHSAAGHFGDRRFWAICGLTSVILLGATTVIFSLSRGGIISLCTAGAIIGVLAVIKGRLSLRHWMLVPTLAAILAVLYVVGSDSISQRLATLKHPYEQSVDRLQIGKDICTAWPRFALFGTGLGTHEYVYPMFEHTLATPDFDHAENEFAQMLEETGAVGLAITLLFVGFIIFAFFIATREGGSSISVVAFGLGVGLLAITIQSFADFGQHRLANAVLTAVECALLLNVARLAHRRHSVEPAPSHPPLARSKFPIVFRRAIVSIGAMAFFVVSIAMLRDADGARRADAYWESIRPLQDEVGQPLTAFTDANLNLLIESIARAHAIDPANMRYGYWLAAYRWTAVDKYHDQNIAADIRPAREKELARSLIGDFNQSRMLCPTYAQAVYMSGVLEFEVLDQEAGAPLIRLASELAPTNPTIAIENVYVDCMHGDFPMAVDMARHYLSLTGMNHGDYSEVAEVFVGEANRPDLAVPLAGDDPKRLMALVRELRNHPNHPDYQALAATLEAKAAGIRRAQLVEACHRPDASADDLAEMADIYRSENRWSESIEYYQRALVLNYGQVEWRLHLAQAMLAAGRPNDAVSEAEICLRLQPQTDGAQQVIGSATTQPSYSAQP